MLVVGPGLFPDRLRRSSACACAAAAVCRKTHTLHTELHTEDTESYHVMSDKAYQIM